MLESPINLKPHYLYLIILLVFGSAMAVEPPAKKMASIGFPKAEIVTENTVRIPFRLADHLILVEANIQGKKGNLIIDTGAENLVLNTVHFDLKKRSSRTTAGWSTTGEIEVVESKLIDNFSFSDFEIERKIADLIDLAHLEKSKKIKLLGIIGYDVLKDYEIFIDFHLKQITLFSTNNKGERLDTKIFLEEIKDSIAFKLQGHSIMMQATVGKHPIKVALDTGAEINFISKDLGAKLENCFTVVKRLKLKGMSKKTMEVLAGKLYRVKVGNEICGIMRTLMGDLSEMKNAYGVKPDAVFGFEFIGMKRLLINYKKKQLFFVKLPFENK